MAEGVLKTPGFWVASTVISVLHVLDQHRGYEKTRYSRLHLLKKARSRMETVKSRDSSLQTPIFPSNLMCALASGTLQQARWRRCIYVCPSLHSRTRGDRVWCRLADTESHYYRSLERAADTIAADVAGHDWFLREKTIPAGLGSFHTPSSYITQDSSLYLQHLPWPSLARRVSQLPIWATCRSMYARACTTGEYDESK